VIDQYKAELKPSFRDRIGLPVKSSKAKTVELLEQSIHTDFEGLKQEIDGLEQSWAKNNGEVSGNDEH